MLTLQLPNGSMSQKQLCFCLLGFFNSVTQKILQEVSFWMTYLFLYLKESGHFLKFTKKFIDAISYLNVGWQDYQGL